MNLKGGDKLTLAVPESERLSAASPGVDPNMASPQSTSLSLASSEQSSSDSPTTPVTITHFQQSDAGTLEKKTVPECNNPFLFAPTSPALRAASSKNPFATDPTHSNNPFLLRLASPHLGNRVTPIASETASTVEKPVAPCPSVRSVNVAIFSILLLRSSSSSLLTCVVCLSWISDGRNKTKWNSKF